MKREEEVRSEMSAQITGTPQKFGCHSENSGALQELVCRKRTSYSVCFKMSRWGILSSGPVVRILSLHCRGLLGLIVDQGSQI